MSIYTKIIAFLDTEYAGEDKIEFMKHLAQKLSGSSEEQWEALDADAQEWYNVFAASYEENAENPEWMPPELEGLDEAIEEYAVAEKPKSAGKVPKVKAVKEPKEPKEPKVKEPKEPKELVPSNSGTMRELLAESYDQSLDDLMNALEERGFVAKRSSAHIVWFNTQRVMDVLLAKGYFKNKAGEVFRITKE